MHIVQVVESLDRGGLERMALDLAVAQKRLGHSTSIYCLHERGALADEAESAGVPVTAFLKPRGFSVPVLWAMGRALRAAKADAVQTHNPGVHHYAAIAGKLSGRRVAVVSTRHSALTSKGLPYQERWFNWVMPLTGAVVFVCDDTRRKLAARMTPPAEKSHVIFNGIRLDPYRTQQAAPGSVAGRVRFGTIGRMVPAKAHEILLDAFAAVRAELPHAELWLGGYGEREAALREQAARLGLAGTPALRMEKVTAPAEFYAGFDIFVLSSVNEGLPLVTLEAMAAGLPVVSTRVGGSPEVAPEGEVAWYCEPGSAKKLASAMLAAARAGAAEWQRRGARARELALSRYGVEHMAAQYDAIFRKLTEGR